MPRVIPLEKRVAAVIRAIRSVDASSFSARPVRAAFRGRDFEDCCFRLVKSISADPNLSLLITVEPACRLVNWTAVQAGYARAYSKKLLSGELFPKPILTGRDLLDRAVLGPRFHGNAISSGERILMCVRQHATGGRGLSLPKSVSMETAVMLCFMAEQNPGLGKRLASCLPAEVFSASDVRPTLFARLRQELGLFADTLELAAGK